MARGHYSNLLEIGHQILGREPRFQFPLDLAGMERSSPWRILSIYKCDYTALSSPCLSDGAVILVAAAWFREDEDFVEMQRELCIRLLRHLGWWSLSIPLAVMATLLTKGKVVATGPPDADPTSITTESLAPSFQKHGLVRLMSVSEAERLQIRKECEAVITGLDNWLWKPDKTDDECCMHSLVSEVKLVLTDVATFLTKRSQG